MKRSFTLTIFVWVLVLVLGTFQAVANGANPRLFEGAPQINPPSIIGNYPSTPFRDTCPFMIPVFSSSTSPWGSPSAFHCIGRSPKVGI